MCGLSPPGARGRMGPGGGLYTLNWGRMCTRNVHKCAPECAQKCAQIGQNVTPKHPPGRGVRTPQREGGPRDPPGARRRPPAGGDPGPMCGFSPPGARRRPPQQGGWTLGQCAASGPPGARGGPPWGKGKNGARWRAVHPQLSTECVPECAQMCTRMCTNVCRNGSKNDPETPPWGKAKTPPAGGVTLGQCTASGPPLGQGEDPPGARRRPPQQGGVTLGQCTASGPPWGKGRAPLGQGEECARVGRGTPPRCAQIVHQNVHKSVHKLDRM